MHRFSPVQHFDNGLRLAQGERLIEARAISPTIWRIRIGRGGKLPEDASWAVLPGRRVASAAVTIGESDNGVLLRAGGSHLHIALKTGAISIEDLHGQPILTDALDTPASDWRGDGFVLTKALGAETHLFGLGDKPGKLDLRDRAFSQWTTDSYAFEAGQNPLYKDIPFFLGYEAGRSFGVLLDNTWRKFFDFGVTDPEIMRFGALGGGIDYYVFTGPTPADVVQAYHWLTGTPPMPPKWALGYHHSRYSYKTAKEVRALAKRSRKEKIPADVIWLDLHVLDQNRAFTVDKTAFPKFRSLVAELHARHFRVVMIADMHLAEVPDGAYAPYMQGKADDAFVYTRDGATYRDKVWPGVCVFPEFTQEKGRAFWGRLMHKPYEKWGVDGIWNDMNEPAVFNNRGTFPPDVVHRIETEGFAPRKASHAEIHNVYGMLNAKATFDGLLALQPDRRPFVMMRASYAGGHRYGVTWTGDNVSTWEHLRMSTPMLLNLGLSGFAFAGVNLGGFVGNAGPELLTRWLQVGMFNPIADNHADLDTDPQEPWVHGAKALRIRREAIDTRYRLLPYLYTLAEETSRTGLPMMRPLFLEFPQAAGGVVLDRQAPAQFMLGSALMIAPPPYGEMPGAFDITLPPGGWYDFWTGARIETDRMARITGNSGTTKELEAGDAAACHLLQRHPEAERIAVFARAGSILPCHNVVQSTAETPDGPLRLHIYAAPECHGSLYDDDGETYAFQDGQFLRLMVRAVFGDDGQFTLTFGPHEGVYPAWWEALSVTIFGIARYDGLSRACREGVTEQYDAEAGTVTLTLPAAPAGRILSGKARCVKAAP